MELDNNGVTNLVCAVLNKARRDYVAGYQREKIKKWLFSDAGMLWIGDVPPKDIVKNWDKQAAYAQWRVQTGCKSCRNKQCVHVDSDDTYMEARNCKGFKGKRK